MTPTPETVFSALSHPIRLRALVLIQQMNELCVCELTHTLAQAQPSISRQLAQLKSAGLLLSRRQGIWMYYHINSELPEWVLTLIRTTAEGVADTPPYQDDLASLHAMPNRPTNICCN